MILVFYLINVNSGTIAMIDKLTMYWQTYQMIRLYGPKGLYTQQLGVHIIYAVVNSNVQNVIDFTVVNTAIMKTKIIFSNGIL